jgi:hypothetical protein
LGLLKVRVRFLSGPQLVLYEQQATGYDQDDRQEITSKIKVGQFFNQEQGTNDNEHDAPKNVSKVHGYFLEFTIQ